MARRDTANTCHEPEDERTADKELKVLEDTAGPVIPAGHPFHTGLNQLQPDITIETESAEKKPIGMEVDPLERKECSNRKTSRIGKTTAVQSRKS
jgi:hypothetical protein